MNDRSPLTEREAPSFIDAIRAVLPHLWPKDSLELRARVVLAMVFLLSAKLIGVLIPFAYKAIVDGLTVDDATATAIALPLAALFAYGAARLGSAFFREGRDALFAKVSQRAGRQISLRVFRHLFDLSLRYHLDRRTGELARAIDRGVQAVTFMLGMVLFNIVPTMFEFVLVIGILLVGYHWSFAAITAATIVAYVTFSFVATEWRIRFRRELNEHDNAVSAQAVDSLLNYETVKSFTNEGFEAERLDRAFAGYERAAVKSRISLAALNFGQAAIIAIGVTLIMIAAAQGVVAGTMTVGDVVLVNTFLLQLYQPLNVLGMVYRELKQAIADLETMAGLLSLEPEIVDKPRAAPLRLSGGTLDFERVSFAYNPARPVLNDLSFTVPEGQTLAVVGSSGAGKSTLVRLLFRFYDVTGGRITIDGQDVRNITQTSLRAAVGIVPQDTILFNDTIRANIAYGRPEASEADIEAAAQAAQIHDFISGLPERYGTLVGERGLKLSGGEKQRVAIARMFLKDPPIVLLDEATSSLDSLTEQQIQSALRRLAAGRTTLVIAHRLSTVVDADRILVLEAGQVREIGRHQELLARGGAYAEMWARQLETRPADTVLEAV